MQSGANRARTVAANAFESCLDLTFDKEVTEAEFGREWLALMSCQSDIYASGWYVPPPDGLAVLTGTSDSASRTSFGSLRDPENWPSERKIDWSGYLYAYCSPVDRETGLMGDFAITLFLGESDRIREHFLNSYVATQRVLQAAEHHENSLDLFKTASKIFSEHGLRNEVVSITDSTPLDLGHSFPRLPEALRPDTLDSESAKLLSKGRKFLNEVSDWRLDAVDQYTIEPQLRSTLDESLPQVAFHYAVQQEPFAIFNEPDVVLRKWGLTR